MKAVRQIEGTSNEMSSGFIVSCFNNIQAFASIKHRDLANCRIEFPPKFLPLMFFFPIHFSYCSYFSMQLIKEEKVQRTRDLRTIQVYR